MRETQGVLNYSPTVTLWNHTCSLLWTYNGMTGKQEAVSYQKGEKKKKKKTKEESMRDPNWLGKQL